MEYLKRFVQWFVSGIALACGVALVALVSTRLEKHDTAKAETFKTLPIDTVQVSSTAVIPFSDMLSVSASILSAEKSNLVVTLQLSIAQDGQVIYSCARKPFSYSHPGKPQRVQLDCNSLRRESIPKGASMSVQVTDVQVWPP